MFMIIYISVLPFFELLAFRISMSHLTLIICVILTPTHILIMWPKLNYKFHEDKTLYVFNISYGIQHSDRQKPKLKN